MGNYASDKKNTRHYGLKFTLNGDADIIAKLESVASVQGYLKDLIRNDIMKEDKAMYTCIITSNFSLGREYEVSTKSAMKCAEEYGRCEGGEKVTVKTKSGKILSQVIWSPEDGGKYIRVAV